MPAQMRAADGLHPSPAKVAAHPLIAVVDNLAQRSKVGRTAQPAERSGVIVHCWWQCGAVCRFSINSASVRLLPSRVPRTLMREATPLPGSPLLEIEDLVIDHDRRRQYDCPQRLGQAGLNCAPPASGKTLANPLFAVNVQVDGYDASALGRI